ncbi:helix-turn-helix domain-containing protein [Arthrobacter sp. NyZ413]
MKMLAVHLSTERGMPSRRVAKAAGVTHTTVDRWAKTW